MSTNADSVSARDLPASLPQQLRSLVRSLIEAAEDAREAWERSGEAYEEKRDGSRVTAEDRSLDRFLRRELEARGAEPVARLPFAPSDPERTRIARALGLEAGGFQRAIGPMIATLFWGASRLAAGRRNVLYDWDLAAPELVAREAGGTVTDLDGRPLRYGASDPVHPGGVVATGPGFDHERALEVLANASLGAIG